MKVQRVSLETIARIAGVHKATVSRSLRNHPTIPKETRDRIQSIAKDLGYRPNPLVTMFQVQARSGRPENLKAAIGWFNDYPVPTCWQQLPWLRGYYEGAAQRCQELGYRVEQINVQPGALSVAEEHRRIASELLDKGIYGLVLPLVLDATFLRAKWDQCVISLLGSAHRYLPDDPHDLSSRFYPQGFPSADRDHYHNVRLAFQSLTAKGYRRIGLVYSAYLDNETEGRAISGFLVEQRGYPEANRIPILSLERFKEGRPAEFDRWLEQESPDAILCVNPVLRAWLESLGRNVPEGIGLANLNVVGDISTWSGIVENHAAIGAASVDLIISALSRNELGQPPVPRKILVPGTWVDGETTRGT
jgi:LacI family transcriptional regulator